MGLINKNNNGWCSKKIALFGTKFRMKQDFYKGRLTEKHSIEVIVPNDEARDLVHEIIYNELCLGNIKDSSKQEYIRIIEKMTKDGEYARGYFRL